MSETENYLMINKQTNVCDNITIWDGNINTWEPPLEYLMLAQSKTIAKVWGWDDVTNNWVLVEKIGEGQIGFAWDGNLLITNQPLPESTPNQPLVKGAETF